MKKQRFAEAFNYSYEDLFTMEDIQMRHLYLNGEVDENIVNTIIYHIIRFNVLDKEIEPENRQPIIIYINSPGGNLSDGMAALSAIQESITPVYTVNIGLAASAACYIFMAGHKRYSMPHSEFLIHEAFLGDVDHLSKVNDRIAFLNGEVSEMLKDFVLKHSKITEAEYDKQLRVEWYMLPPKAQELGYVDYIIGKDCTFDAIL